MAEESWIPPAPLGGAPVTENGSGALHDGVRSAPRWLLRQRITVPELPADYCGRTELTCRCVRPGRRITRAMLAHYACQPLGSREATADAWRIARLPTADRAMRGAMEYGLCGSRGLRGEFDAAPAHGRLATQRDKDIAAAPGLGTHGVRYHIRNIFWKLEVGDRTAAVPRAHAFGIRPPAP